jgi:solute carrier family 20 (sodium-dependent phosphate transporter)
MYPWIFGFGILFAFYNAWGIGANDCANSFATSVGAKVLTLKSAVIIAGIFEFSGAVLMGSHVTDAIRKNIISPDIFDNNPGALMYGMLCADLSSALWLTTATYFKYPVSTTHSIIGAIIGFALAYGGNDVVSWDKVGLIVASWIISPVLAGVFSLVIFTMINRLVFMSDNPYDNTIKIFPLLTFVTFFINTLFIIYKGSPQLDLDELELWKCLLISFAFSTLFALISLYVYVPYVKRKMEKENILSLNSIETTTEITKEINTETIKADSLRSNSYINAIVSFENLTLNEESNTDVNTDNVNTDNVDNDNDIIPASNLQVNENDDLSVPNLNFMYDNSKNINENIKLSKNHTSSLESINKEKNIKKLHDKADTIDPKSDKLCSWIQIITACFSSFAHGSNDVANAIAPLATIYYIYKNDKVAEELNVPIWILFIGGLGIVIGLLTWGYKIIDRIGRELTKITPSRGFIIELSAALTVIIASRAELPVSTTHCQVGSILGCGVGGGLKNVDWKLVKGIVFSWIITLPITGFLSAALFSFGYYSPNEASSFDNIYTNNTNMSLIDGSGSINCY